MAATERPFADAPLEADELDAFLLWLYTNTGYAENVKLWRASLAAGAAKPTPPHAQE